MMNQSLSFSVVQMETSSDRNIRKYLLNWSSKEETHGLMCCCFTTWVAELIEALAKMLWHGDP